MHPFRARAWWPALSHFCQRCGEIDGGEACLTSQGVGKALFDSCAGFDVSVAAQDVEGTSVAAFGHPMLNIGEVYFPISTAEVHSFMPSLAQSFKLASPIEQKGTLVQDRQACIVGDSAGRAEMIPVTVRVSGQGRAEQVFSDLAPRLALGVTLNENFVQKYLVTESR